MNSEIYSSIKLLTKSKLIRVETSITRGLPSIKIVGMADKTIRESKERVIAAIKSSGFSSTPKKIRINLAPTNLPKKGSHLDLPITLGIITLTHQERFNNIKNIIAFGELGLNGEIKESPGIFSFLEVATNISTFKKDTVVIIPKATDEKILQLFPHLNFLRLNKLSEFPQKFKHFKPTKFTKFSTPNKKTNNPFKQIKGFYNLKRTLTLAVAGKHNLLIMGPTGTGKSLLLNSVPKIFPAPTRQHIITLSKINNSKLTLNYPNQKIDKNTTAIQLQGNFSNQSKIGIATLVDQGTLLIDNLTEIKTSLFQNLNQLLDKNCFTKIIDNEEIKIPCDFLLVATMRLCPCGKYGKKNNCTCSNAERKRFLSKIPQNTLNRIDLVSYTYNNEIKSCNQIYQKVSNSKEYNSPVEVIQQAWNQQKKRFYKEKYRYNSRIPLSQCKKYCKINSETQKILNISIQKFNLNPRSILKVLQISRTIADLSQNNNIKKKHLLEALSYKDYRLEN